MLGYREKWMKRFQDRLVDEARPHQSVEEFEEQFRNTLAVAIHVALRLEELNKDTEYSEVIELIRNRAHTGLDLKQVSISHNTTTTFKSSYESLVKTWLRISEDYNKIRDERIQESRADIHEKQRTVLLRFATVLATGIAAIFIFLLATWLEIEIPLLKIR